MATVPKHEAAAYEKYLKESTIGQVTANYGKGYPEAHKWSVVFEKKNEMYFAYAIVYHKVDEPLDWAIVQESWACPTRVEAPGSLMEDAIYEFTVSKK